MSSHPSPLFNPFPGLRPFGSDEKHLFFGREDQTGELLQRLRQTRFLAVVGPSGSGKSSLVRAGLLPELHGGTMTGAGSYWEVVVMRPGGDPLTNLAAALVEADFYDAEEKGVVDQVRTTLDRSARGLIEAIRQSKIDEKTNTLVVVDQFEEIFRFREQGGQSLEEAAAFVKLLLEASGNGTPPIYVVLTMRSDYLGDCAQFRGLAQAVNEGEYLIPRLTRAQKRSAITGPVQVGGAEISKRLLTKLLNDVGDDPDQLPVLQHALMRTWDYWASDHQSGEPVDLRHYQATGGMQEALSRHADEVYESLPGDRLRRVAERVFKALTEKVDEHRGIRRPMRVQQLSQVAGATVDEVNVVVEAFRKKGCTFLMPPESVALGPKTIIDISHESLMRIWQRLRHWVDDEAQSAGIYRRLVETAHLHAAGKAGPYHDPDLPIAQAWHEESQPNADWAELYGGDFPAAVAFLERSQDEAEREEREREAARQRELAQAKALAASQLRAARLLRRFAATVVVALVIAIGLTIWAFQLKNIADAQTQFAKLRAEEARRAQAKAQLQQGKTSLALAGTAQTAHRQFESRLLAARAVGFQGFGRTNQPNTFQSEFPVLLQPDTEDWRRARELARGEQPIAPVWISPKLRQHPGPVSTVAAHPNGKFAASSSESTTSIYVWDLTTGQRIETLAGHSQDIEAMAFSHNGSVLASAADRGDGAVILWNTTTWKEERRFQLNSEGPHAMAFSADDNQLLAGDEEGKLFRIDLAQDKIEEFPDLHPGHFIYGIEYSRDGSIVVVSDATGNVTLHDPATLQTRATVRLGPTNTSAAAFFALSPDGSWMAVCSRGYGASIWDVTVTPPRRIAALGARLPVRPLNQVRFDSVAISSDSRRLVLSGNDRRWLISGNEAKNPMRPTLFVFDVSNPRQPVYLDALSGHGDFTRALCSVPHSHRFFSGDETGLLLLQDADAEPKDLPLPAGHTTELSALAYSPDGRWFVSADVAGTVLIWNAPEGRIQAALPHRDRCRDAVFSANSRILFTTDHRAQALYAWEVQTGRLIQTVPADYGIEGLDVSPSGDRLVTCGASRLLTFYAIAPDGNLTPAGNVSSDHYSRYVRFLADGSHLVATSDTLDISLFGRTEAGVWQLVNSIKATHTGGINHLAVHPSAPRFATSSWDGSVKLWDVGSRGQITEGKTAFRDLESGVTSVEFSPGGSRLLTTDASSAKLWDLATGQLITRLSAPARTRLAVFSPDEAYLLLGNDDGSLHGWFLGRDSIRFNLPNLGGQPANLSNETTLTGPFGVAFIEGGRSLLIGGGFSDQPSAIRILDLDKRTFTRTLPGDPEMVVRQMKPSPDGRYVAVAQAGSSSTTGSLSVWDLTSTNLDTLQPVYLTNGLATYLVSWYPDGDLLEANHGDGTVRLWERSPGGQWGPAHPHVVSETGGYALRTALFTPDGSRLIVGSREHITVYPFDRQSHQLGAPQTLHYPWTVALATPPNKPILASGSPLSYDVRFWDLNSLQAIGQPVTFSFRPLRIQYSPDGRLLAVSGTSGNLVLLDVSQPTSPVTLMETSQGGGDIFRDLAFSPDSSSLACSFGGTEGFVRVYRVRTASEDLAHYANILRFTETSVGWAEADNPSLLTPAPVFPVTAAAHPYLDFLRQASSQEGDRQLFAHYIKDNQIGAALAALAARPDPAPSVQEATKLARLAIWDRRNAQQSGSAPAQEQLTRLIEGLHLPPELELELRILDGDWQAALQTLLTSASTNDPVAAGRLADRFFEGIDTATQGAGPTSRERSADIPPALVVADHMRSVLVQTLDAWNPESRLPVVSPDDADSPYSAQLLDLLIQGVPRLVAKGATWHYFPEDAAAPLGWNQPGFDDSKWPKGPADIGFGGASDRATLKTIITHHPRRITYYFRHQFVLPKRPATDRLELSLQLDDGAALYLNGIEVLRDNLRAGPLEDTTRAIRAISGEAESTFYEHSISGDALVAGTNTLAVEVHQANTTSSDIHLDLALFPQGVPSSNTLAGLNILKTLAKAKMTGRWAVLLPAFMASDPAAVPNPANPMSWVARSLAGRVMRNRAAELDSLRRAVALLETSPDPADWRRHREILQRIENLLVELGRTEEAKSVKAEIFSPPPRPANRPANQLDLTRFYNAGLYDPRAWMSDLWGKITLKTIPIALSSVNGVGFDIRGIIQLNSGVYQTDDVRDGAWIGHSLTSLTGIPYPDRVEGIPVGRNCQAVRFLGGVLHERMDAGTEVGRLNFHYADGSSDTLPLRFGENIYSFWGSGNQAAIVWTGRIPGSFYHHQLGQVIWQNPHPERAVASFDFVSSGAQAAPFMIAATVE
jgi:WD40 repeat protein/energy-coupling factor transporter ATP-binding protein EcfA2